MSAGGSETTPSEATAEGGPGELSPLAIALLISVTHGITDAYVAFLPPLLPRMMREMGISIALAASLATVLYVAAALPQPLLGYLADRHGRRLFVAGGPLAAGVLLSLLGVAPNLALLVALLVLGGIGSAAFHPPGAAMAARIEEGGRSGLRYSLFSVGGTVGFAVGPLAAVGLTSALGLEGLWVAMLPAVVCSLILLRVLPRGARDRSPKPPPRPREVVRLLAGPLGLIFGISAASSFVQRVYMTMTPMVAADAGRSDAVGAVMLSTYLAAQGGGSLVGGWLTDRMSRRWLLLGLSLLALPAHLGALWLPPATAGALTLAAAAGFFNMAMLPPLVVGAQELVPRGASVSSGIAMGLAWAAGSLGVLGTGVLGDLVGARMASLLSMPALLICTLLALHPALEGAADDEAPDAVGATGQGLL